MMSAPQTWGQILGVAGVVSLLVACGSGTPETASPESEAADPAGDLASEPAEVDPPTAAETPPAADQEPGRSVKVFFPKQPQSQSQPQYVEPVWRTTTKEGVARFALTELLAGPSQQEAALGLQPVAALTGASSCGGEDFRLAIADRVAAVSLCREPASRDRDDLTRLRRAVEATLTQFPTVDRVALRDRQGECLSPQGCESAAAKQAPAASLSTASRLTLTSLGPLAVGMTMDAASQAANQRFTQVASGGEEYGCLYFRPQEGPEGVSLMVIDGKIARIDIDTAQIATLSGIRLGDTAAKVRQVYGDRLEAQPHEYVPGGQYLIFVPTEAASQDYRVGFETDERGIVTRMRNGLVGAALAIEGCV